MATALPSLQRFYRAPCPGCGAPVEFRSAQSTHAVCAYCQSTVARQGDVLARVGKMAELFEDYSPLQLLASGRFGERPFTLIGRLQYKSSEGSWTEWNAWFDDGASGWLAEDNGAYVLTFAAAVQREVPPAARFVVGAQTAINGKPFSVAGNLRAMMVSAQGELPKLPPLGQEFDVVELRSTDGEVLSIDYHSQPPVLSRGFGVQLEALQLQGLKGESAKQEAGRQFSCPHCGASVVVALATTKAMTCGSCDSLIDLSRGLGGELKSAVQEEPVELLIPLGAMGQLQSVAWQVVGFQHRMGQLPGDDEQFGWSEYLLFHQKRGFCFLVDSGEGWSLVRPTTGSPTMANKSAANASYLGTHYVLESAYDAETIYVKGEFYWPVARGQKTSNRDFTNGRKLLSLERSRDEAVWSSGERIDSAMVAKAFGLEGRADLFRREDAAPLSSGSGMGCGTIIVLLLVMLVLAAMMSRCSRCDPEVDNCTSSSSSSYRSSGGSYGGFSGGGGHK